MRVVALAAVVGAACGPRATPANAKPPEAGIAISLYREGERAYGVVDDRRWVEVTGSSILLANIDPGAALASLVIESTDPALRIGPCSRERLPDERDAAAKDRLAAEAAEQERGAREHERVPRRHRRTVLRQRSPEVERFAPVVQCDVNGPPGRHLVRVVYVSTQLTYRVQHDIVVRAPSTATIESRFAFATPPWRERADVTVFDGVPGALEPPRELVRGQTTLDGGTSVLVVGATDVPAELRRIFTGLPFDEHGEEDYSADVQSVWVTLEVPDVKLAPGPMRVHVELDGEERWIDIPALRGDRFAAPPARDDTSRRDQPLRIKLWIDQSLRGARQRMVVDNDGVRMVEIVALSMANTGDVVREVWLEEHARPAKRRAIERAWPNKPSARGDVIRNKLVVKPGRIERAGYAIVYEQ